MKGEAGLVDTNLHTELCIRMYMLHMVMDEANSQSFNATDMQNIKSGMLVAR